MSSEDKYLTNEMLLVLLVVVRTTSSSIIVAVLIVVLDSIHSLASTSPTSSIVYYTLYTTSSLYQLKCMNNLPFNLPFFMKRKHTAAAYKNRIVCVVLIRGK